MIAIAKKANDSSQEATEQVGATLIKAFNGEIRKGSPEPSSSFLVLSRTLVASLMPLTYVSLLGVVAYYTFYHALFGLHFNQGAPFQIAALLYVLPLLSGLSFTAVMIRPFFRLSAANEHRLKLHENDGAEFLQLVSLIQQRINNTSDIQVELSMLPVVYAEPNRLSVKQNNGVTLVVGMPLIKTMTVQQISALVCHELAHYTHRSYRLAYRWNMLIDHWFDNCLQGRDGWKAYFTDLEHSGHNSAYVVAGLIGKWAIVFNDSVLNLLHKPYLFLSSGTLKQLDRDADQSAVLLSGSQGFIDSLEQLDRTNEAWKISQFQLLNPTSLTLADNFVDYVCSNEDNKEDFAPISRRSYLPPSWMYHSDSVQRVDFAKHENIVGILNLKTPVSNLFKHFPTLCKSITPLYYKECGLEFSLKSLKPVASNSKLQVAEKTYKKIIEDYTSTTFSASIVWDVKDTNKITKANTKKICRVLNEIIGEFRCQLPIFQEAHSHYSNTQKEVLAYLVTQQRLKYGYITEDQIGHQTEASKAKKNKLANQMAIFDAYSRCTGVRLSAAVLLDRSKSTLAQTLTLLGNLQQLYLIQKQVVKGRQNSILIEGLSTQAYSHQEVKLKPELDSCTRSLNHINRQLFATLSRLPGELKNVSSITKHLQEQMKLKLLPGRDDASKAQDLFAVLEEEFCSLNTIITGRLVDFAMKNEIEHNIQPVRLVLKPTFEKSA